MALPDRTLCWVEGPPWDRHCDPVHDTTILAPQEEIERLREGVKTLREYIAGSEGQGPVRYAEALDLADGLLGDLPL